ncbi:MAG: hypothetical protein WC348_04515 [Patescibacteria group bacterium]|jgi:hypothetical protein
MTEDFQSENFICSNFYKKYYNEIEIFNAFLLGKKVSQKVIQILLKAFYEADVVPTIDNISFIQLRTGISPESLGLTVSKYNPFSGGIAINQDEVKQNDGFQSLSETFKITVRDREIWINDYLLSKPHAVGNNFEFFDYVRLQPANTEIKWEAISEKAGWLTMKENIKGRRFVKILNALGFVGEVTKVFFYKVGPRSFFYRGDEVSAEILIKEGINIPLFIKELERANLKNSSK